MSPDPGGNGADESTDDDRPRCGSTDTNSGDPCRMPVSDPDDRCFMHPEDGSGPPEGHGSGDPDHTMGDGDQVEGNKNAMTHGVYASKNDPWGTLEWLQENEPQTYAQVVRWFWDDAQSAAFDVYMFGDPPELPDDPLGGDGIPGIDVGRLTSRAADLLQVALDKGITYRATMQQSRDGLATVQKRKNANGEYVDVVDENPVNIPKNRMRREDRQQLKDLGLREESPEAVAAQGSHDLAAAAERVAKRRDGGDDDGE